MSLSNTLIFIVPILALFVITFLWGLLRGLAKTRFRAILIIGSAVAAVITTIALKSYIQTESFVNTLFLPILSKTVGSGEVVDMIASFLGVSPTMNEVLLGVIGALLAPMICLACFLVYSIITWIVFAIISLCRSGAMKRSNALSSFKPLRILAWALVQTLVVIAIYMIPVSVYSEALSTVLNEVADNGMLSDSSEELDLVEEVLLPIDENMVTATYRTVGGKALCNLITDFEANGTKTHLNDEVGAVTHFSCDVFRLTKTKLADMSEEESQILKDIADSTKNSALLSTITGEVIYSLADCWKSEEAFLGVAKPHVDDLFDPLVDTLVDIFYQDAKNDAALHADFHTLADVVTCLASHDILKDLSNPDALIEKMNGGDAINEMTAILNANESMKPLVPEVTNLGMRAIASTLGLSPEEAKLHDEFMGNVTGALNDVKGMERDQQVAVMNDRLEAEFVKSGVKIEREKLESYSGSMIDDLLNRQEAGEELTESDLQAFFITYALDEIQKQKEAGNEDFKDIDGIEDFEGKIPNAGA